MEQPYKNIFIAWAAFATVLVIVLILSLIFFDPLPPGKLPPGGEPMPFIEPGH